MAELFELGFLRLNDAEPQLVQAYREYLVARKERDFERVRALFNGQTAGAVDVAEAYEAVLASETILEFGDTIWLHLEGGGVSVYTQVRNSIDGRCVVSLLATTWNRENGLWKLEPKKPMLRRTRSDTDLNLAVRPVTARACARPAPGLPAGSINVRPT